MDLKQLPVKDEYKVARMETKNWEPLQKEEEKKKVIKLQWLKVKRAELSGSYSKDGNGSKGNKVASSVF